MEKDKEKGKEKDMKRKCSCCFWFFLLMQPLVIIASIGLYQIFVNVPTPDLVLTISEHGFEGRYFDAQQKEKVIITFSGSDGGSLISDSMAFHYKQNNISALSLTLFGGKETVKYLDRVPLEYVEKAIDWLRGQGYDKIGVDGISKGSEYALLAASKFMRISCVVARVPSYFVSEGLINGRPSGTSCWSYKGEEIPYVPYKVRDFNLFKQFIDHHEFNILEYNTGKNITEETIIPMEKIKGPILLISSSVDTIWPSAKQSDFIVTYLQKADFPFGLMCLRYDHMSHVAIPSSSNLWLLKLLFRSERQNPQKCAKQRAELSADLIDFVTKRWY